MIEGHGDDLYRYAGKVRHNFSSNILQNVDHSRLMKWLASRPGLLSSYPEPAPVSVERKIEALYCYPRGSVMVTSGATDAIYLIARYFSGAKSWIHRPTFSEYEDACRAYDHSFTGPDEADVVWMCVPNNPDGTVPTDLPVPPSGCTMVLDLAYADYSVKAVHLPSAGSVLRLHSLTKRFSVPGLRVGYIVGDPSIITRLKELRMPWSVGSVAIAASHYLLDHADEYPIDARGLNQEARRIADVLSGLGCSVSATGCNFFLAGLSRGTAAELKAWLIENHGILIRDASNITGSAADIRVAAQTHQENNLLINAITEWLSLQR